MTTASHFELSAPTPYNIRMRPSPPSSCKDGHQRPTPHRRRLPRALTENSHRGTIKRQRSIDPMHKIQSCHRPTLHKRWHPKQLATDLGFSLTRTQDTAGPIKRKKLEQL